MGSSAPAEHISVGIRAPYGGVASTGPCTLVSHEHGALFTMPSLHTLSLPLACLTRSLLVATSLVVFQLAAFTQLNGVCTRQMTDNIFEIETSALAQCTCMLLDSGILSTDFARACPSVHHRSIFRVLDKADLPLFIQKVPSDDVRR